QEIITIPTTAKGYVLLVHLEYTEGDPELYALGVTFATAEEAARLQHEHPESVLAHLRWGEESGILYDAFRKKEFCQNLLDAIRQHTRFKGMSGELVALPTPAF